MREIEVIGTVQDVANVIQQLYQHMEVVVVGPGAEEVGEYVVKTLKDFKVAYKEQMTDEGHNIKIFD
ncbi:hypothetical protein QE429_003870 [Bacillus sp. SORGH_AS 510]|uniref:hypothetical protein n=1 Tax=Bacillus sp. SORGH_AS_0510 TaxID=3041771 RepID=UPI0027891C5B|nr:hypothetical protein [Bacillus sp. SORGH_AS_0510]MDQ1147043.1 hypothetical protein [Bacillus sp. SORGH_AS_0510]